jgi:hypothetical protein
MVILTDQTNKNSKYYLISTVRKAQKQENRRKPFSSLRQATKLCYKFMVPDQNV